MDHQKFLYKNKSGKAEMLRLKRQTFPVCTPTAVPISKCFFQANRFCTTFLPNMIVEMWSLHAKGFNSTLVHYC